ncbi:glutathione peroxidase [Roseovarius phycicola]|uniref:Glutathione peroxidase n=1 Tax=Roseovarius phycicola TaxID=3080976 RepID=A0ABZ2HHL0_9RHOB
MRSKFAFLFSLLATPTLAVDLDSTFTNIDGGTHQLSNWEGQPILVVNTASLCGFTGQYSELQELHDTYSDQGLVVLAVPSDDFSQELGSDSEVKEFCEVNYDLTLPMTGITHVVGANAHPFYKSLATEEGFEPNWNFNKVLIDAKGEVVGTFRSSVNPMSRQLTGQIEEVLNQADG